MCSCFTSSQADPSVTSRSPEARRDPAASRWARRRGAVKTLVIPRGQVSARRPGTGRRGLRRKDRRARSGARRAAAEGPRGLTEAMGSGSQAMAGARQRSPRGSDSGGLKSPARWPGRPGVRPGVRLPGSRLSLPRSHSTPRRMSCPGSLLAVGSTWRPGPRQACPPSPFHGGQETPGLDHPPDRKGGRHL